MNLDEPHQQLPQLINTSLEGIVLLDYYQYSIALPTPLPGLILIPESINTISTPHSAPANINSSILPKCPILNTLPLTLDRPTPSERLYFAYAVFTMRLESMPWGTSTTVRESDCQRGYLQRSLRPQPSTALRVPSARRWWRATTFYIPIGW